MSRAFRDHLNGVLHTTITAMPLSLEMRKDFAYLRFRGAKGSPNAVPLDTRYGPMYLELSQICTAELGDDRRYTLHTTNYRYALTMHGADDALFMWEYVRLLGEDERYCRHHFQGAIGLGIPDRDGNELTLNGWHLPTGWVPVEEIIRFCIVDLGVEPVDEAWHQTLTDSYQRFRIEFSSPGD